MGLLFLSLCTLAATRWHELDGYHFERYRQEFGKMYATAEEAAAREAAFNKKLKEVRSHNAAGHSWKRGVNHLTDRTPEELSVLHGLDRALLFSQKHALSTAKPARPFTKADEVPSGVDWRRQGAVTPVKNQGHCGSCWTFASAETVESRWFLKTGELQDLSEQFILDCTPNPHACGGTGGCGGGTAALAYERLKALGGLPSEWVYPYLAGQTSGGDTKCHGLPLGGLEQPHGGAVAKAANVSGHVSLEPNSYDAVMHALTAGPLAVSVDAGGWHDYEEGVFGGGNHSHPRLDHLVQLVGYGTNKKSGKDYWVVRNSWGTYWGVAGWFLLERGTNSLLSEEHCDWAVPDFQELDYDLLHQVQGDYYLGVPNNAPNFGFSASNLAQQPQLGSLATAAMGSLAGAAVVALAVRLRRPRIQQVGLLG